ncbi:ATP-binding protein, partial [Candidatus Parcubacteria bacterium]
DKSYGGYTVGRVDRDPIFRERVRTLLRLADVGIADIEVKTETIPLEQAPAYIKDVFKQLREEQSKQENLPEDILLQRVATVHQVFDKETKQFVAQERFDIGDESDGTQKFFHLLGPWLDTLENGYTLFVDEMDARLHPLLTRELVRMFLSPQSNPHNAQLIFTTHDAGLLRERLLRRDEVWFTEKNRFGATELYSLADMRERNDAPFYKNYLLGLYGAIPHLGGLRPFVEQEMQDAQNAETERAQETA